MRHQGRGHPFSLPARASTILLATVLLAIPLSKPAAGADAAQVLARLGQPRGLCVVLEDKDCRLAIDLVRSSDLTVYVQLANEADLEAARRAADDAGFYGSRIFVQAGGLPRIHLADNLADALIAPAGVGAVAKDEVLRVLRPQGKALLGEGETIKPVPAGIDEWSHHYHGPDNNTQSKDTIARAPYLTQFVAEPRYAPAPQCCVASGGRVFMAFGHVAWHEREEPCLNTLFAVNGYNGTLLWKMALRPGIMVDRSTMIATPETLYLADDTSCKIIDAATGKVAGEIVAPPDLVDGPFWKWMALEGGVLYALVGKDEGLDDDAKWKSANHGWPWDRISKGYNDPQRPWGFATTLLAIDPKTKKVLWRHKESEPIDARGVCMKGGRLYVSHFGRYIQCLDATTGKPVWRRTAEKDAAVFEAIGSYRPGQGYIAGWKTAAYLKCTDKALYFAGPQVNWLTALAADDGRFLWKYSAKDVQVISRDEGLYAIGAQGQAADTKLLDPLTGSIRADFGFARRACTRVTGGPDGVFFRASEGSVRLDTAAGKPQWITPMRPSCHVGVIVAGGQLYWLPWACDCNLQMFGVISLGPAGNFNFDQVAGEERLQKPVGAAEPPAKFDLTATDWPTYRANNSRTAETRGRLPQKPALLWQVAPKASPEPTAPVAAGGMVFLGGSDGIVRALDAATGKPRWAAYTGGAIRYPPAIADGRALVGSGDGWAYAFEAATGRMLWRFQATPQPRKIAVYGALVDTWPVASGVLAEGGAAYLAAGINNFDGTHVYALDAATGRLKWQNNDSGHLDKFSRRGVAVQGDMLLDGGKLYLAGGDAVSPGIFDLSTGKCLNNPPTALGSSAPRGRELKLMPNGNVAVSGQPFYSHPAFPVFDKSVQWEPMDVKAAGGTLSLIPSKGDAGPKWSLVARGPGGAELWAQALPGEPVRWGLCLDRDGRIIVTLRDGRVICYGAGF
jgi:outer membrane protein assembly factor BamB